MTMLLQKNEKGKPILAKNGLPEILDEEKKKAFNEEVMNFMTMTVDVDIFYVDEALFNYDDSKYETLTPKEINKLKMILCDNKEKTCE